jgi:hypothetical protein
MSSTSTIFELKEQAVTDTPLLLFDCTLANGMIERWSTHAATVDGASYAARVLQQNVFEMQTASAQGVDGIPQISLALANADSHCSEIERATGWKGARLKASFLFYDLKNQRPASDIAVLFQGICNSPDEIRQSMLRLTATNRMSLQRVWLPQVRIQRRCPWRFPATPDERAEATNGGADGRYSKFYRCGYSADRAGGMGTLNGGAPFTSCGYTRAECQARGMLPRFGGLEYVPPSILVRSSGAGSAHLSAVLDNSAAYNDFVPLVYGTAWYTPPVVFSRNDGNITRMEVLLGMGPMRGVLKVLVNDVEIPRGIPGFPSLANTRSISSATLTLHYWDELVGAPQTLLGSAMGAADATLTLNAPAPGQEGSRLQIDCEVLRITEIALNGAQYMIERAIDGSTAVAHDAGAPVYTCRVTRQLCRSRGSSSAATTAAAGAIRRNCPTPAWRARSCS